MVVDWFLELGHYDESNDAVGAKIGIVWDCLKD